MHQFSKESLLKLAVILLSLIIFVTIFNDLILQEPPPWPDEALFADVGNTLIEEGYIGLRINKGLIPEIENHAFWYPPSFFYINAIIEYSSQYNILLHRYVNGLLAIITLILVFVLIFKTSSQQLFPPFIALLLLATDFIFIRGARISRPEILVLCLIIFSMLIILPINNGRFFWKKLFISALIFGLAITVHPISLIYLIPNGLLIYLTLSRSNQNIQKSLLIYTCVSLVPLTLWLITIAPNINIFINQFFSGISSHTKVLSWLYLIIHGAEFRFLRPLFFQHLLTLIISLYYAFKYKVKISIPFIVATMISLLVCEKLKMEWYYIYPVTFAYITYGFILSFIPKVPKIIISLCLLSLIMTNLSIHLKKHLDLKHKDYQTYSSEIIRAIPPNVSIFISAIPDPYFSFKHANHNSDITVFPVQMVKRTDYITTLNMIDYIIITQNYDALVNGPILLQYIRNNYDTITTVGNDQNYSAKIVKLVSRKQRK